MSRIIKFGWAVCATLVLAALGPVVAQPSAMPPEGSLIENIATARYINTDLNIEEFVESQPVLTRVRALPGIEVEFDQHLERSPGETAFFSFTVSNTGNTTGPFESHFGQLFGDYAFDNIIVARDQNANGRIDAGETFFEGLLPDEATDSVTLEPGRTVKYLVEVAVPETVTLGQEAGGILSGSYRFEAQPDAEPGQLTDQATATVSTTESAVDVQKQVSRGEVSAGDDLRYTLILQNNSSTEIPVSDTFDGNTLTIDGVATEVVLLVDNLPVNTVFDEVVQTDDLTAVFSVRGGDPYAFVTEVPQDPASIRDLAFISTDPLAPGTTREVVFDVTVADNAAGATIENVANFIAGNTNGPARTFVSNPVNTVVTGQTGVIDFFSDPTYSDPATQVNVVDRLYVQLQSGLCNASPEIDEVDILVSTRPSGDLERVRARETGPNTGVFRAIDPLPISNQTQVFQFNGELTSDIRDTATATVECDPAVNDTVLIVNGGYVFVSSTNEPVPDALVELIDMAGSVVETSTTDERGRFELIPPDQADYTLVVTPPTGFEFPSVRTEFDGYGRNIDMRASYRNAFTPASGVLLAVDIPIDPPTNNVLTVQKTSEQQVAQPGTTVRFTVEIRNSGSVGVENLDIVDTLPAGLSYVRGTAQFDGEATEDPAGDAGPALTWTVDRLSPATSLELSYAVRILPTVQNGDLTNVVVASGAQSGSGRTITSNQASASIEIDRDNGVFSGRGALLGKVFLDCDADGFQEKASKEEDAEPGIPGVTVWMDDGTYAVTDEFGRFSFQGVTPRTHVLKIQKNTLPSGTELTATRVMDARDPGNRIVPMKAGEIRSEDFAVRACSIDVLAEVAERQSSTQKKQQGQNVPSGQLALDNIRQVFTEDYKKTSRFSLRKPTGTDTPRQIETTEDDRPADVTRVEATVDLKSALTALQPGLDFLDLRDGSIVARDAISVRIKHTPEASITLSVNGQEVPDNLLGNTVSDAGAGVALAEYVGVALSPGANTLTVRERDTFGNERAVRTITIVAPGKPARVELRAPAEAVADPLTPFPVIIRIVDKDGIPTSVSSDVTLIADKGDWDAKDIRDGEYGLQTYIDGGEAVIDFIPPDVVGSYKLVAKSAFGESEAVVDFVPDTGQAPVVVGVIEGALKFGESGDRLEGLLSEDQLSVFEDTEEGINGKLFLKGKIRGDALLTLRYDSDRDTSERLFRDVEPDRFYPVYGDTAGKGFDARSGGDFFVKVEKDRSYVLYGDVRYTPESSVFQLAGFQRSVEGAKAHIERGNVTLNFYAAETDASQVELEIPGQGISGPYDLNIPDVVANSEVVEIITRDKDQPAVVLSSERLSRYTNYTLDYFARTLIFTQPVPSVDENFNPVYIRVTLETEEGDGEKYWIYGGEARIVLTEKLAVGLGELRADAPSGSLDREAVRAAYIEADLGALGIVEWEAAGSVSQERDATTGNTRKIDGSAHRFAWRYQTDRTQIDARWAFSDEGFSPTGASITDGRQEIRLRAQTTISENTKIAAEALNTAQINETRQRTGVVARIEHRLSGNLATRLGTRYVSDRDDDGKSDNFTTAIAGVNWAPAAITGFSMDLEGERDVSGDNGEAIRLGLDWRKSPRLRYYLNSEWSTSEGGDFALRDNGSGQIRLKAGLDYRLNDKTSFFSEYRAREGFYDAGIANGLALQWAVRPEVTLRLRGEHVEPVSGVFQGNSALSLGGTWKPEDDQWVLDGNVDWALSDDDRTTWYLNKTAGYRVDDFTFLARNRFALAEQSDGERLRDRLRVGSAWRPTEDDRLNALAWYEFQIDDTEETEESAHIWSVGGEYKPNQPLRLRSRYAGQLSSFETFGVSEETNLHMLQFGADMDVLDWVNLGANLATFTDGDFENGYTGLGAEASFIAAENALISLGYNHTELDEEDIRHLYDSGFYVRLRLKMNDDLWGIFDE